MHVLIVGNDPRLPEELRSVLSTLNDQSPVIRVLNDPLRAGDAARSWRPQLALVQMTRDLSALRILVGEIAANSPETSVVGVFEPDLFEGEGDESTFLIQALRTGLSDFLRRPVSRNDVAEMLERLRPAGDASPATPATIVSFLSNKGGVGKTTLAVNTAVGLARRHPERVLLVDCSLQIGLCAPSLGLRPRSTLIDAVRERERLDETLIRQLATPHDSGLDLLAAPEDAIEATEIDDEFISRVLTLARRTYDYIVVDTFPIFDRTVMTILDLSARTYIVLDNLAPTVLAAARLLSVLDHLRLDATRQSIVANRMVRVAGGLSTLDIQTRLQRPVDHAIPYDVRIMTGGSVGRPFALQPPWFSRTSRSLANIVDQVERDRAAGPANGFEDRRIESVSASQDGMVSPAVAAVVDGPGPGSSDGSRR